MKKSLIFLLALMLAAVFALPLMEPARVQAAPADNAGTYYYDMVNSNVRWCYDYIKAFYDGNPAASQMYEKSFPVAEAWTSDFSAWLRDFHAGDEALKADHPEYEWKGRVSGGYVNGQNFCLTIDTFELPTEQMQKRADARVQQIVSAVGTGDRYTKLRKLTDLLIRTSFYDPYLEQINMMGNFTLNTLGHHYNQSSYGLLLEGVAVCDGFSQSVKLLCNKLDIPCIIVGNAGHAWNLVQMDNGGWYLLDLTTVCPVGWDKEPLIPIDTFFQTKFLNNSELFGMYGDPYMINIDNHRYVTEFPALAAGAYTYTGGNTNFSYTVPASTYTPGAGKFLYKVNRDKTTCTITHYEGRESGDLTIPGTLDGYTVTAIDGYAFYYCSGFTGKLTVPDTVETIGQAAFAGCYGLTSVKLPAKLHKIGQGAFLGCKGLTEVTIPDLVDEVGDYAFDDCGKLATVTFGSHIRTVGFASFRNIASGAVIKAPADSAAQTYANQNGMTFRASGTMCSAQGTEKYGFDDQSHYKICQHGGRFDYGSHTCDSYACGNVCDVCHAEACMQLGFLEKALTLVNQKPASCNMAAYTGDWQCVCGNIAVWGNFEGDPTGQHAPADNTWSYDDAGHYQLCSCGQQLNYSAHTGGTATATQQAICTVCGDDYGPLDPGYTGTVPPVVTTVPTTGAPGPGTTVPSTNPGAAPTVPTTGPGAAPTVPNSTGTAQSPTTTNPAGTQGKDPTKATTAVPGTTTGGEETPGQPGAPVIVIVLICVGAAAAGVGGFFGFRALQKKKKSS